MHIATQSLKGDEEDAISSIDLVNGGREREEDLRMTSTGGLCKVVK